MKLLGLYLSAVQAAIIASKIKLNFGTGGKIPVLVQLIPSEIHEIQAGSRMVTEEQMNTHAKALYSQLNRHAQRTSTNVKQILDSYVADGKIPPYRFYPISNTFAVEATPELIEILSQQPQVEEISSNKKVAITNEFQTVMNEGINWTGDEVHWSLNYINATNLPSCIYEAASRLIYGNADTGVEFNHPALAKNYIGLKENGELDHNYAWWDANQGESQIGAPCTTNTKIPCDDHGHGSHTTGTVIGGLNLGVSPTTKWMACKNMYRNLGSPESYLGCLQFFLAPTDLNGKNPRSDLRPHVIGNSYGCPAQEGCSLTTFKYALKAMKAAGIFMSVSAGNDGRAGCSSVNSPPATDPNSFTVAATKYQSNERAWFSSLGPVIDNEKGAIDVAAPGVNITSSVIGGRYASLQGTSMASPHVAGAVLLITAACPRLTRKVDLIGKLLHLSATPILPQLQCGSDTASSVPNNEFGYGIINVAEAIRICRNMRYDY